MDFITNFNQLILPENVAPIAAKGGKRRRTRKHRTRKHRRSNKSRTRRHH